MQQKGGGELHGKNPHSSDIAFTMDSDQKDRTKSLSSFKLQLQLINLKISPNSPI